MPPFKLNIPPFNARRVKEEEDEMIDFKHDVDANTLFTPSDMDWIKLTAGVTNGGVYE